MSNVAEIVKQEQDRRAGADDAAMRRRVRRALDELARAQKQMTQAEIDLADARKVLEDAKAAVDAANAGDPSKLPADPGEPQVGCGQTGGPIFEQFRRLRESDVSRPFIPDAIGDPDTWRRRGVLPMLAQGNLHVVEIG